MELFIRGSGEAILEMALGGWSGATLRLMKGNGN